ncbi:MAG: hypothetical protein ACREI3_12425 [Nitrospirales bacterium]
MRQSGSHKILRHPDGRQTLRGDASGNSSNRDIPQDSEASSHV